MADLCRTTERALQRVEPAVLQLSIAKRCCEPGHSVQPEEYAVGEGLEERTDPVADNFWEDRGARSFPASRQPLLIPALDQLFDQQVPNRRPTSVGGVEDAAQSFSMPAVNDPVRAHELWHCLRCHCQPQCVAAEAFAATTGFVGGDWPREVEELDRTARPRHASDGSARDASGLVQRRVCFVRAGLDHGVHDSARILQPPAPHDRRSEQAVCLPTQADHAHRRSNRRVGQR
mmetsp:Transcript_57540/g.86855  ORF Transcript_57540/g.86855 Transcript_57540/m.86855 type:complete len:232 (-) Transcript_57540:402-1097(-)